MKVSIFKYFVKQIDMCENYSGPAKSGPIKRLTRLTNGLIKLSRLYFKLNASSMILLISDF